MGIPVDVYEVIEDVLGKEPARKLVHGLERAIEAALTVRLSELKDELFEKLVTKEVFLAELHAQTQQLRVEFQTQIHGLQAEVQEQIHGLQTTIHRLNMKVNFLLILVILLLTVMNPTFVDLIKILLGLS